MGLACGAGVRHRAQGSADETEWYDVFMGRGSDTQLREKTDRQTLRKAAFQTPLLLTSTRMLPSNIQPQAQLDLTWSPPLRPCG